MLGKKGYEVGILFGFDNDKDARDYCLRLMKKYENTDKFTFFDLNGFERKESKIKFLSNFSKVCFGIHSCDESSPVIIELEFCEKGPLSDIAYHLKKDGLIDILFSYSYEIWKLRDYPINFGIIEIFGRKNAFYKFEQLLLQTLELLKR